MTFVKKYKNQIALSIIIALGAIIRFIHIDKHDYWRDEAFSIRAATKSFHDMIEVIAYDTAPPLHTIILYITTRLFGSGELATRMPSYILSVISIYLVYLISKNILKDKIKALFPTLLVAFHPLLIQYSQEARNYSLFVFLTLITFLIVQKIISNNLAKYYAYLAIFTLLGLYTHNLFLFVAITNFLLILYAQNFKLSLHKLTKELHRFNNLIITYTIVGLGFLPWFFILLRQLKTVNDGGFWLIFHPLRDPIQAMGQFIIGENNIFSFDQITLLAIFCNMICLFMIIISSIYKSYKTQKVSFESKWLILNILFIFFYSFITSFFYIRYLIYLVPILIIIVTREVFEINFKSLKIIAIIILIITPILMYQNYQDDVLFKKSDSQSLIDDIEYSEDDLILHSRAFTHHAFNVYSNYPNYVYNPYNELKYFEGLAVLDEDDYYRNPEINSYNKVWLIYLWEENQKVDQALKDGGYYKTYKNDYNGSLHLELWQKK